LKNEILSLGLTIVVGLSMGLGGLLSFFIKGLNKKFLAITLSFAAGIMIYVSFMEMLPEGMHLVEGYIGERGNLIALGWFFGGMLITAILEKIVHIFAGEYHDHNHGEHIHHKHNHNHEKQEQNGEHLSKLGVLSAIAIAMHNIPEGLALFTAGLKDISLALPIAVAVIIHNIPLSVAIAVPLYYSTGSRKRAFIYTLLVGLCQPIGAILGYVVLDRVFNDLVVGALFSIVAGIMIFVALDELLPSSQRYEDHHLSVYGAILGMLVMAISLSLLGHHH
jgi:ZIP family zinc transporter